MSTFITSIGSGAGGGDMLKSVYDPQDTGIVLSAHKEMVSVINKTGVTIPKGTIVYLKSASSSGTHPEILLADADTEATSSKTLGATYEDIDDSTVGYVVTSGEVDNLNTSMYSIGAKLWLSQTAGQVTTTPPVQPAHTVFIGTVTRSQNTNGRILYAIQNGYELEELHNVLITGTPSNGQVLTYNSTSSLWINQTPSSSSGGGGFHMLSQPIAGWLYLAQGYATTTNTTSLSNGVNNMMLTLVYPATTFTISELSINVVAAASTASNAKILVYSDDGFGYPRVKLIESSPLSLLTTGAKTYLTSYTFEAGKRYWMGVIIDASAGATVTGLASNSLYMRNFNYTVIQTGMFISALFASTPALNTTAASSGSLQSAAVFLKTI
jgi:hypothetical protein